MRYENHDCYLLVYSCDICTCHFYNFVTLIDQGMEMGQYCLCSVYGVMLCCSAVTRAILGQLAGPSFWGSFLVCQSPVELVCIWIFFFSLTMNILEIFICTEIILELKLCLGNILCYTNPKTIVQLNIIQVLCLKESSR